MTRKKKKVPQKKHHTPIYKAKVSRMAFDSKASKQLQRIKDNVEDLYMIKRMKYFVIKLGGETLGLSKHLDRVEEIYVSGRSERLQVNWKFDKCLPLIEN